LSPWRPGRGGRKRVKPQSIYPASGGRGREERRRNVKRKEERREER
jgi:hypothetical protein